MLQQLAKKKASIFKGYEVGAVDYLSKPIDPIILRSKARIFKEMYLQRRMIEKQAAELEDKVRELLQIQEEKDVLENITMEDGLTKVYNRRGVDKLMMTHWKNCARYQLPFSVMMFDLDRFKRYNDHYGHIKGDDVLMMVAKAARGVLYRAEDFVGRYGGEEFIVVMPNTKLEGALAVAERVQGAINDLKILHEYNGDFNIVTVSGGVATTYPDHEMTIESLINQADQVMYLAKNNGRNQTRHTIY